MGWFSTETTQETDVDIVNENVFSPNVIIDIALSGLDSLGSTLRDVFSGSSAAQSTSIDQAGSSIANALDGVGLNISSGIVDASENLENSVTKLGANIGFGLLASATVIAISGARRRG